ncbi:P-loop containing nucleoside triphosphate hydrolase protein [Teratosphaeria nubilosa]|uniref:RNA helicase n=1 Tax=Teratosphaeria nubilosa TaxID=161662 RepID=A0A6G1KUM9_9PEZI|nr:P-loop containing nucleoside triphosphate hydrolase protein [Teratosphaeria nubilosa]
MKRKLNVDDVPEPVTKVAKPEPPATPTFASLNLDARLLPAITKEKLSAPTPVQAKGIPLALAGKHVLARAKTGSGKTLAYLLPLLHHILKRKAGKKVRETSALILVPTKELAAQVNNAVQTFSAFCGKDMTYQNVSKKEDAAVTRARLAESPDVVIATPGRATQWANESALKLEKLRHLVIDEADLVLNYEGEEDLATLAKSLPSGVQKIFMSATLRTEIDTLTGIFFAEGTAKPEILDLSSEEKDEKSTLKQYIVRSAEEDKFLLIYAIFKLQLIKGRVIVFVADVDRCYRVKLFLEQFGIRSCVLNSELPVNSRLHAVEEFNKGVYDIIIASDESEVVGDESNKRKGRGVQEEQEDEDDEADGVAEAADDADASKKPASKSKKGRRRIRADREFGISRGIDFRNVACVLNFDLPTSSKSYIHRIGRTARAGQSGIALSFYVPKELYRKHKPTSIPQCENDEKVLGKIRTKQDGIEEWQFDMSKLEGLRYRFTDALRSVTRIVVREARTKELRQALINSEKLKRHFEENPDDLRHLRHDTETHAVRSQPHLKHIPDYLLPAGGKAAVARNVGYVGIRKDQSSINALRRRREINKRKGKGAIRKGKGLDPLKSLNARGRGKK